MSGLFVERRRARANVGGGGGGGTNVETVDGASFIGVLIGVIFNADSVAFAVDGDGGGVERCGVELLMMARPSNYALVNCSFISTLKSRLV